MKYSVGIEGEFEEGSKQSVLKNKLGITDPLEMFEVESDLLNLLYMHVFGHNLDINSISFKQVQEWHRNWLGAVYEWAGEMRTVDMTKDDFRFASAKFLEKQIIPLEDNYLSQYPNLANYEFEELVRFLARFHVELILMHPFREGNGRLSRFLNDVFVTSAGYKPLDYKLWHNNKEFYFKAIQAGVGGDYQYIEQLMRDLF